MSPLDAPVSRSQHVAAPAQRVWELVSDLPSMGRYSPENTGGRWVRGDGPKVGAVFRGRNAQGWRRWGTRCTVAESEPGRVFAFDVSYLGLPVARWRFDVEADGASGSRLTETWTDRRGALLRRTAGVATGVTDRRSYTVTSIEQTLRGVRAAAEAPAAPDR